MAEVDQWIADSFRDLVIQLSQQKRSRFMNTVLRVPDGNVDSVGQNFFLERLGSADAIDKVSLFDDTENVQPDHTRRRGSLIVSRFPRLVDRSFNVNLLVDPTNAYVRAGSMAMGRRIDKHIIDIANAAAFGGKDGTTSTALPAAQIIASGGTGLTLAKILEVKEKFRAGEADDWDNDGPVLLTWAIGAKQITDLLGINEIKNSDFNVVKSLAAGRVTEFSRIRFIPIETLTLAAGPDRQTLVWAMDGIGLAIGKDVMVDIGPRRDKNNATQILFEMAMGAVRVEDLKVVQVDTRE